MDVDKQAHQDAFAEELKGDQSIHKSPNAKSELKSDPLRDQQIEQLSKININLRQKIKELNVLVEKVLERQTAQSSQQKDSQKFQLENLLQARQSEMANAQKQIEQNEQLLQKLQTKLAKLQKAAEKSGNGSGIDWESKYREQQQLQAKLESEIKSLEKQNALQGIQIQKAADTEEKTAKLKTLGEELRVWKQKVAQLAGQLEKEQAVRKDQQEKISKIQEENSQFQDLLEQQKPQTVNLQIEKEQLAKQKKDQEQMEKETLKQELEQNLKSFKKQEAQALEQNRILQLELDQLTQQLKEKEQLQRISQFKLNELKRNLKHGQLKPIEREETKEPSTGSKSITTNPRTASQKKL